MNSLHPIAAGILAAALASGGVACGTGTQGEEGADRVWECQDGLDNDHNGLVDCEQSSCASAAVCTNEAPTAPTLKAWPNPPTADRDVLCLLDEPSEDADGDDLAYEFSWANNGTGEEVAGYVLPKDMLGVGETWTCTAKSMDSEVASPETQLQITLSSVVGGEVEIRPPEPRADEDLFCALTQVSTYDDGSAEGLSYSYTWSSKGSDDSAFVVVPGQIASILGADQTTTGDEWRCSVQIAGARALYGVIASDIVTITEPGDCEEFYEEDNNFYTSICRIVGPFLVGEDYLVRDYCESKSEQIVVVNTLVMNNEIVDAAQNMTEDPAGAGFKGFIWLGIERAGVGAWRDVYGSPIGWQDWSTGSNLAPEEYSCAGICVFPTASGDECVCDSATVSRSQVGQWCALKCEDDVAAYACEGGEGGPH